MRKQRMTSGLFWEISCIAITWNPESNCTCRKKNHILFRWSTSTLPEKHIHHWMSWWRKIRMLIGTWMEIVNRHEHGQVSQDSCYWTTGHLTDVHGPSDRLTRKQTTFRPDNVWSDMWKHMSDVAKSRAKQHGLSRNESSIMPDNFVVSSSLTQKMMNSNTPWKTLVESWNFRFQQQCVVKHQQIAAEKPAAILGNTRSILLV